MLIASNIRVCISDDYELGTKSSVPFGGFYSCQNGNPLVNGKFQKSCPKDFSNHLALIENDCEIQYCVRTGQLSDLKFPTVQLPPFSNIPAESIDEPANYVISHSSESWAQLVDTKMSDISPDKSTWTTLGSAPIEMEALKTKLARNHPVNLNDSSGMSKGAIAGLSVGLTTAFCLVVGLVIAVGRNRKNKTDYNSIQ